MFKKVSIFRDGGNNLLFGRLQEREKKRHTFKQYVHDVKYIDLLHRKLAYIDLCSQDNKLT